MFYEHVYSDTLILAMNAIKDFMYKTEIFMIDIKISSLCIV